MLNNILKVYDEDLLNASIASTSIGSDKAVAAGETQGALCVNVFAKGNVSTVSCVTISIKHGDSENGAFAEVSTISIAENQNFKDGELMATMSLPQDVKAFVTATATSATENSGGIRVTLGYLAR